MVTTITTISSLLLCFIAASLSSAGGVGGGSLYLPILNLVVGLDLKTSATISAFMVTAGSISNVIYTIFFTPSTTTTTTTTTNNNNNKPLIDYEIALLSQPCMLLGVSVGVVCNVIFPEWLITALFALFLGVSTFKTFRAGFKCWGAESEEVRRDDKGEMEVGLLMSKEDDDDDEEEEEDAGLGIPWGKMVVLVMVWLSFFVLHVIIGDKGGKSVPQIKPCGVGYWIITLFQVPLAVGFTVYILYMIRKSHHQTRDHDNNSKDMIVHSRIEKLPIVVFPLAALLSGVLGGLFGIGGGLLINPVLLHIGIPPQVTASTTSFMVLFSSSMSMVQYLILGMTAIKQAMVFAVVCFVSSVFGLVTIQRVIKKSGRASLIVFSVSTVMALSTISITFFGAVDVWGDYMSGKNMGFKFPC